MAKKPVKQEQTEVQQIHVVLDEKQLAQSMASLDESFDDAFYKGVAGDYVINDMGLRVPAQKKE